jgi:hypothetical protein
MKKVIITLILFIFIKTVNANDVFNNSIILPKHYKTENTFSGNLSNKNSFHLIFTKNKKTKNYEVFSYLFDGQNITKLKSLVSEKSYGVVSFHQKDDILSILFSYKKKKKSFIKRIDYNLISKEKNESEIIPHEDFLTSIRQKERSILIYKNKDSFKVLSFLGASTKEVKEISFTGKKDKLKTFFKDKPVSSIKTDEFVANGATSEVRLYFENNTLFFTKDSDIAVPVSIAGFQLNNKKTNTTQVLKIDLSKEIISPSFSIFTNSAGKKFKKRTSFYSNNILYQLGLSKKEGQINVSNISLAKTLKTIPLDGSLAQYIKGNDQFVGVEKFLKNAGKNKHNITITANKTNTDKIRLRVDYVDITYSYNYNWWWHHQQFMWHQQQHQMFIQQNIRSNIPRGFGPNQPSDIPVELFTVSKEKRFFEILIDANGVLSKDDLPKSIYKEINKKEYIDKLEKVSNFKMESSCFLEDSFRFIAYSKKLKHFTIQTNVIK